MFVKLSLISHSRNWIEGTANTSENDDIIVNRLSRVIGDEYLRKKNRAKWRSRYRLVKLILIRTMICVKDGRSTLLCKGKGVEKSESLSCSLTTHLHVAGNFGSRGRALCGFSTVSFSLSLSPSLLLPPPHPVQVSLEGAARMLRGPEERGSLSREEIVFPSRGAEIFLPTCVEFLAWARRSGEGGEKSSDASPDALYGLCRGLISG